MTGKEDVIDQTIIREDHTKVEYVTSEVDIFKLRKIQRLQRIEKTCTPYFNTIDNITGTDA